MKIRKILLSLFIASSCLFSFASCQNIGENKNNNDDIGKKDDEIIDDDKKDDETIDDDKENKEKYKCTILPSENGTIVVDKESAFENEEVIFTITPNDGFIISDFILNDKSYLELNLSLIDLEDSYSKTCSVNMIEGGFVVSAIFEKEHHRAENWVSDPNYHWHWCIDYDCEVKLDYGEHIFGNGLCEICGYVEGSEYNDILFFVVNKDHESYTVYGNKKETKCYEIIIPSYYKGFPVNAIGNKAFDEWTELKSVKISSGITNINEYAFSWCSSLESIDIPNSVTTIGNGAFHKCPNLKSIDIPNSVTTIGRSAFSSCSSLESIYIPSSVTNIDFGAFSRCEKLNKIEVDEQNAYYDSRNNCNAIIETSTNTLLLGCVNTIMLETIETIGDDAFNGCTSLKSINIPDSVKSIGSYAFSSCSGLKFISIPNSVTSIGAGAFYSCTNLNSIDLPSGITCLDEGVFNECKNLRSITIPDSVTSINSRCFKECTGLETITIPSNVASIGLYAFSHCVSLNTIKVDEKNKILDSRDNCNAIIETSTNKLIAGCSNTTIPNTVEIIGKYSFDECVSLSSITIPEGVKKIDDYAFSDCKNLTSVSLSNTVENIGIEAFSWTKVRSIIIPTSIKYIWNNAFDYNMDFYYLGNEIEKNCIHNFCVGGQRVWYYYSETKPTEKGNYWHYDSDNKTPVKWDNN